MDEQWQHDTDMRIIEMQSHIERLEQMLAYYRDATIQFMVAQNDLNLSQHEMNRSAISTFSNLNEVTRNLVTGGSHDT